MWVGRRDSPAAETDAMVVRLNFSCQAPPPSTGQKQTQTLVVSVCVSLSISAEKERLLTRKQALPGATRRMSNNCLLLSSVHLQSLPLCFESFSHPFLHFSAPVFLILSSCFRGTCFPSAGKLRPAAVKTEDVVRGWGAQRN